MADQVDDSYKSSRASIIVEARKQVEKQQAYFNDKAESQWATERGQFRTTAALVEISRIDDETLSSEELANAREFRELKVDQVSHKARGSSYDDASLPERLLNAPEIDQPTRDRVTYFTGGQKRRGNKNNNTNTNMNTITSTYAPEGKEQKPSSASSKRSTSKRLSTTNHSTGSNNSSSGIRNSSGVLIKTIVTKRPSEAYWHHLEDEEEKKKNIEVEDDPTRDPYTLITELKKLLKHAIDPNAISLRIGRQYLRLVYGTSKTAAEVANNNNNGASKGVSGKGTALQTSKKNKDSQNFQTPKKKSGDQSATNGGRLTPKSPDSSLNMNKFEDTDNKNVSFKDDGGGGGEVKGEENKQGEEDAIHVLTETFSAKQQRERREQLKIIELERAAEARKYLSYAIQTSDPEGVVDRRVTTQDIAAEERKLRAMAAQEKELFLQQKKWNRAKAIVDEREVQRLRIRSAAHELWLLELHMSNPIAARDGMRFWLETASGETERLATLQVLHESLASHEKLLGDYYSANTHALYGSLGELGDLHLLVLGQLREAFPYEQHYLYALGRLESKRLGKYHQRKYIEAYVDASMSEELDKRKETKSNGYYHRRAAEAGEKAISKLPKQEAVSHWQANVREERQALEHRDDFIRGSMPSDAHLNLTHQSAATTIHSLPQGGWNGRLAVDKKDGSISYEVGFRMEDTIKALKERNKTCQYLLEPTMMAGHQLKTRNPITTVSPSISQREKELIQLQQEQQQKQRSDERGGILMPSSNQQALIQYQDPSKCKQGSSHSIQATGQSHPRILEQGVPAGLMMSKSLDSSYPVMFSAVDGSAQKSMLANRCAELDHTVTDVMAQPRRYNPRTADFDVRNLYSTSC